jgi:hypothetical protein
VGRVEIHRSAAPHVWRRESPQVNPQSLVDHAGAGINLQLAASFGCDNEGPSTCFLTTL